MFCRWVSFCILDFYRYDFHWYRFNVYWQMKSCIFVCIQLTWGIHNTVDFISTAIVLILSLAVLILSEFVFIFSNIDSTWFLLIFFKELLMELVVLIVTEKKWQKVPLEMFLAYLFSKSFVFVPFKPVFKNKKCADGF